MGWTKVLSVLFGTGWGWAALFKLKKWGSWTQKCQKEYRNHLKSNSKRNGDWTSEGTRIELGLNYILYIYIYIIPNGFFFRAIQLFFHPTRISWELVDSWMSSKSGLLWSPIICGHNIMSHVCYSMCWPTRPTPYSCYGSISFYTQMLSVIQFFGHNSMIFDVQKILNSSQI